MFIQNIFKLQKKVTMKWITDNSQMFKNSELQKAFKNVN